MKVLFFTILVISLTKRADAGYYERFHEAVETECTNKLSFHDDVVHFQGRCQNYDSFVRLERSPKHMGYGLMANRKIERGQIIMSEVPLFMVDSDHQQELDDAELESYVKREKLPKLNWYELEEFWLMADTISEGNEPTIRGILDSNMFDADGVGAVLPKISRINHSCKPNLEYVWDGEENVMNVIAIKDIEVNQELYNSYINNLEPREQRQKHLLDTYGFLCNCELCSANDSDRHDALLGKLDQVYDFDSTEHHPEENVEYLQRMLEIARIEDREHDSVLMGEIYVKMVENLLNIPDHAKRFKYNLNLLAQYAFQNLTLTMNEDDVLDSYPIFEEKFSYLLI